MSENNAEAVKVEEEGMHDSLESSKRAFNNQSSNLVNPDDELLSWLQYPIDYDTFHHWPPPLTTSPAPPASADFLSSSSSPSSFSAFSSSFSSSSSPLISSSLVVRHLPQLENEAFKVAKDLDRSVVAADDWILRNEDIESEIFQGEQRTALKNKGVAIGQEGTFGVKDHSEAYHLENRGERGAGLWASRLLDWKQGFVKDSRKLAQLKPTSEEEREGWAAREAQALASKGAPHPMHSHSDKVLTAHSPPNEEDRVLQRKTKAQEETLLQYAQASNEECWLKDMNMKLNGKEGTPIPGRLQAHSNVDAALALGAGRAAGSIQSRPGMEAFTNVRTAMQPTLHVPIGSPSSSSFPLSRTGKNVLSPGSCNWMATASSTPVGSSGSMPSSQLSYQTEETKLTNPAQLHVSKPSAGFSNMGIQENQFNMGINIKSNITKTSSSELLPIVPLPSPQEVGTENVLISEETLARGSGAAALDLDTTDMQKLSSVSFLSQERIAGTCSGGSQTSESLREPDSGIKRKFEDSECQSCEEVEEDSVVSSQARTSTSSKRPRANEVHNLSERRQRNRINDKMNALRELIPNASKSNKAALLDEAIDYLKNLQLQLQVMSMRTGVSVFPMVLPSNMPPMRIPQYGSLGTMGMDMSRGSALASAVPTMGIRKHKIYAVPAGPSGTSGSVSAPLMSDMGPSQPLAASHSVLPVQSHQPHVQASSQVS